MLGMGLQEQILLLGGIALGGFILLRSAEAAITGGTGPQAASAFGAGAVQTVGAGISGAGGAVVEGLKDILGPGAQAPLRTIQPVLDVRQIPFAEQIGFTEFPIITSEQLEARKRAEISPPRLPVVQEFFRGETSITDLMQQLAQRKEQPSAQASGQFWVNPITGASIAPFVPGQTPAAVKRLRQKDIFPAIRSI